MKRIVGEKLVDAAELLHVEATTLLDIFNTFRFGHRFACLICLLT